MKKILILILLFFITGCSSKLNINNEINSIKYNNNNIYYQDYDTIINDLNSIKWNCVKNDNNYNESNLIINTKDSIINFYFSNNYYMEYKKEAIIKLNKSNSYLVLDVNEDIYNFKIHQIEKNNGAIQEIDLLYDSEFIDKKILIRIDKNNINNYKINFKNKYNYDFEIFLNYNENVFTYEIKTK